MKIFYDVDTQKDFMNEKGALYVPDAESIKPNLKLLTDFARENFIPVVGSVDRHFGTEEYKEREGELKVWGGQFPNHCMNETFGQMKICETRVRKGWQDKSVCREVEHYLVNNLNKKIDEKSLNQAIKGIMDTNKIIPINYDIHRVYLEKQSYDVFTNPNTSELLARAKVNESVVYGVATDICVRAAVLGMQKKNIQCYVVKDAIKGVFPDKTKEALEEMVNAGAKLVTTKEVLEGKI